MAWSRTVKKFCSASERERLDEIEQQRMVEWVMWRKNRELNAKEEDKLQQMFNISLRWISDYENCSVIGVVDRAKLGKILLNEPDDEPDMAEAAIVKSLTPDAFNEPDTYEKRLARERMRKTVEKGRYAFRYFELVEIISENLNGPYDWKITGQGEKFLDDFTENARALKAEFPGSST